MKRTIVILLFSVCSVFGATKSTLHNKLHHTVKQISTTKAALKTDQKKQHGLEVKLKSFEKSIGDLSNNINDSQKKLSHKVNQINSLKRQQKKLTTTYEQQHQALQKLMKQVYMNSQTKSAPTQDRMAVYEHFISVRYAQELSHLKLTMQNLKKNQQHILNETTALAKMRDQLKRKQMKLNRNKTLRENTLLSLKGKIKSERSQLLKLTADKNHLDKVIRNIKQTKTSTAKYFTAHKHRMPWPVKGKVIVHFGDPIGNTHMRSTGVEIAAPLGTPITAIAPGKVVFNDWMPGFGLLLIIDHGYGYMSIYGHNNVIYKHVDDKVEAQEIIATVGKSGGLDKCELYLSMRHNGKPLNPASWCL